MMEKEVSSFVPSAFLKQEINFRRQYVAFWKSRKDKLAVKIGLLGYILEEWFKICFSKQTFQIKKIVKI